jgi:hypothetical protein
VTAMAFDEPLGTPYAALAALPCPAYDEMLIALEREFRAVDRPRVAAALDDLARPLFDVRSASAGRRATALAAVAHEALPEDGDGPEGWLLGRALEEGRAAAPVRAVLAVELGRRAGIPARPVRMRGLWLVGVHDIGTPLAAELGHDPPAGAGGLHEGCLCAHEIAFAVLGGLASAWHAAGDVPRARRAAGLRLLLPLEQDLRAQVLEENTRLADGL